MTADLYKLAAGVLRNHREELNEEDVCICGAHGDWPVHVGQAVGDMLIDLAGTGQLLAAIDRIAR